MCVAIFSDVHGNLEALEAVLGKIADFDVESVVCLGDVVGYGADPNACIERVQAVADVVLAGNHDWTAVGLEDPGFFNPVALAAIQWTAKILLPDHAEFLRACPLLVEDRDVTYVHASPVRPQAWDYVFSPQWGRPVLAEVDCRLCFIGHSHKAFICSASGRKDVLGEGAACVDGGDRYLVNVGSVGQPRDGDARAAFALWDRKKEHLSLHRVPYDVPAAQAKIRSAGLPEFLAERIAVGM